MYRRRAHRHSFVFVTRDWTYRGLTYFSATQSLALTVFGIIGGMLMFATRRFKVSIKIADSFAR